MFQFQPFESNLFSVSVLTMLGDTDTVKVVWGLDDCGDYGLAGNNFWVVFFYVMDCMF